MRKVRAVRSLKYEGVWRIPGKPTGLFDMRESDIIKFAHAIEEVEMRTPPEETVTAPSAIPDGFPFRKKLAKAGITTLDELTAIEDLTDLSGIGAKSAVEISEALEALG